MTRTLRLVIAALGGEGGGVLGKWISDTAALEGYLCQFTSVPGVAQRTGATIYYLELFPSAEANEREPIMSMFPTPGDVDIVICSEIVEAGRMLQRGFVTPDQTTLITSTHRIYSTAEKEARGNAIVDKQAIMEIAQSNAKHFIGFDMQAIAHRTNSIINAALLGVLAESSALPFQSSSFEQVIRQGRTSADNNLRAFSESCALAKQQLSRPDYVEPKESPPPFKLPEATTSEGSQLLQRIASFPSPAQEMIYRGVDKLLNYQDYRYAHLYLDRLDKLANQEETRATLLSETARFLALWMAFEDIPRVAQIKTNGLRFEQIKKEVRAQEQQPIAIIEFMHPRVEEFCGLMPAALGRFCLNSRPLSRLLSRFAKPRTVKTNGVTGYVLLYFLAKLKRFRRYSLIYQLEQAHIERWLNAIYAAENAEIALEIALCGRLIKGYGDTRERSNEHISRILERVEKNPSRSPNSIKQLREAALKDASGEAFAKAEQPLADSTSTTSLG